MARSTAPRHAAAETRAAGARVHRVPAHHLDLAHARSRWHLRQGLRHPVTAPVDLAVRTTGWPRALGGIDVYLALRARLRSFRRGELDAAVERGELQVVPAVRGCMYLVPRPEVPLVLRLAFEQWRPRMERDIARAGSSWTEVEEAATAAFEVLAAGPATPDTLRKRLPAGSIRSLGEAGKKVGLSSVLPVALRQLEFEGRVERTLPGGRLDSERYEWRRTNRNPFEELEVPEDSAERHARLAALFFRFAAPATVKDFACWAGFSQRDARAAADRAGLLPVVIDGHPGDAFAFDEDLTAPEPLNTIAFLAFEDNYLALHGGPAPLTDPAHHARPIPVWGSTRGATLGDAAHVSIRTIILGDRIVGFWEFDPDSGQVVLGTFEREAWRDELQAEAETLGAFIREELVHARSFSLDTDEALRQRAALVAEMRL